MTHLSQQRLTRLLQRQSPGKWGQDYEPGIQVKPREAPRSSRPSLMWSGILGRQMHVMSQSEQFVAILAQYAKCVFEIHEQKILPTGPSVHPLSDHFHGLGEEAPTTRGTVAIAESLGCLRQHPVVYIDGAPIPYNYMGDFLIFCHDKDGPYCVDVTVKNSMNAFSTKHGQILNSGRKAKAAKVRENNRHRIQEIVNEELGIKMVYVAGDEFDKKLKYNLTHLYKLHSREVNVGDIEREYIVAELNQCLIKGIAPFEIADHIYNEVGCDSYNFRTIFYQSVWRRELKPDLYECLQIDVPMIPEQRNPIDCHAELFMRLP